jgi:hypothetical protein
MYRKSLISLISLIALITNYQLLITKFAYGQTLSSDKVKFEITDINIKSIEKPGKTTQVSEEFRKQGFSVQTISPDTSISLPYTISPGAYLVRARPGTGISLPITIFNFKEPLVTELQIIPFTQQQEQKSIDCSGSDLATCEVLKWVSIDKSDQIYLDPGDQSDLKVSLTIPGDAAEGDYYVKLQLTDYNKRYLYTSSDIYITISNEGQLNHSVSITSLDMPRVVDLTKKQAVTINLNNDKPYFNALLLDLKLDSPLGFGSIQNVEPIILAANEKKILDVNISNLPIGLFNISTNIDNQQKYVLSIPYPAQLFFFTVVALVVVAIFTTINKQKNRL